MEMETNKTRSVNFNQTEETLLVYLAKKYKHVLENKKTDVSANRDKNTCWNEIEKEFNGQTGGTYRSEQVLKKKYENIKKRTKKKIREERCFKFTTGGGPHKEFPLTRVDETVLEILGDTRVWGIPSEFGGDAEQETTEETMFIINNEDLEKCNSDHGKESFENTEEIVIEEYIDKSNKVGDVTDEAKDELITQTWAKYTPQMLKTPKSKALKLAKTSQNIDNTVSKKVSQWASAKSSLEEEKRKYLEEEHTTKINLLKEKQEVEIEIIKRESQIRISRIEDENNVVIETLKQDQKLQKEIFELQKLQMLRKLRK